MRLIDADKIDFNEVFKGQSDFARDMREIAQSLIDSQPDISRWTPVNEGLPEESKNVLVCKSDGYINTGYYTHSNGWLDCNSVLYKNVIAWMPLPEPFNQQN